MGGDITTTGGHQHHSGPHASAWGWGPPRSPLTKRGARDPTGAVCPSPMGRGGSAGPPVQTHPRGPQWDLVCASRWKVPLEQTTHLLGWTLGSVAAGLACDRFGRRPTFVVSLGLAVPLGLGVALAISFLMVLVARMLFGAALAGAFLSLYVARECTGRFWGAAGFWAAVGFWDPVGFWDAAGSWDAAACGALWDAGCCGVPRGHGTRAAPLVPPPGLEQCDPPHRLEVTMVAGFFWIAGELLLPGLAVLCRDWRVLQGAVTMILALLAACWWCPALLLESPRWLLATQQLERARKTLQALAESSGRGADEQGSLMAELETLAEGSPQPRYHAVCEIFSTRVIWKNSVILGFTAFIGSGIRHCFTRNLAPHLPRFSSYLALVGAEAVACLFLCLTAERFGRRAVLLLCAVLTGISSLLLLALTQYLLDLIVLTLSVVGITASHAVTMLSIFFASEVLPTVVRGAGLGLIVGASFVGKAAAPITAIPNSRGFFLHHLVFASFAILSVLSIMLLPESRGRGLPQSLQDGESQRRPPLFHRARTTCPCSPPTASPTTTPASSPPPSGRWAPGTAPWTPPRRRSRAPLPAAGRAGGGKHHAAGTPPAQGTPPSPRGPGRKAPGCERWWGWGLRAHPPRGRILPQEELCWESWGGGDAPGGAAAANKSALFLHGRLARPGSRQPPWLGFLLGRDLGGRLCGPPFPLAHCSHHQGSAGCGVPLLLLWVGGTWGCKAPAAGHLVRAQSLHFWAPRVRDPQTPRPPPAPLLPVEVSQAPEAGPPLAQVVVVLVLVRQAGDDGAERAGDGARALVVVDEGGVVGGHAGVAVGRLQPLRGQEWHQPCYGKGSRGGPSPVPPR
uniref:Solute carrier family 22 member 31 n=1 Tax=Cairina moschata TaxID=8855 RepID=A0A8C3CFR7_CAIMO